MNRKLFWVVLLIFVPAVLGCRGDAASSPVSVSGVLTNSGKPADGASIAFVGATGRPAVGLTDAEGKFSLSTFKGGDGALPGKYKVIVTSGPESNKAPPLPGMPGYEKWSARQKRFPAKYADVKTTPLVDIEVVPGKTNTFVFDMTK